MSDLPARGKELTALRTSERGRPMSNEHFRLARLHEWVEGERFDVEAPRISAYAAATNDASPSALEGSVASPVFAVIPGWDPMMAATSAVVEDSIRPLVVHGEQDLWLHEPLRPGMRALVRAAPVGVHVKDSGTTLVVRIETSAEDGRLLNEQYSTQFYRGISGGDSAGEAAPAHGAPAELADREPDAELTYPVDEDQTVRYADASGDHFPIHLDDEAARAVGLPGRIVHGLCVMAFAGRAVAEFAGCDVDAVRRLAVRFSRPVFPGAQLTTRLWRVDEPAPNGATLAFEARTDDGTVVLKDGLAVLGAAVQ